MNIIITINKANIFLTLFMGLLSFVTFGQTQYKIEDFSNKYKGVVTINSADEADKGTITITDIKTNKKIITINSEILSYHIEEGKEIETNILELPYGEQSLLIYDDFNFDGKKDLAIMEAHNSCYGGPSYQVYLETGNTLIYSPEFTKLAQEYCGMFDVDHKTKTIHTMTKSGCCWHQFSDFKVIKNKLIAVKIVEESVNMSHLFILDYIEKNRINGKMLEKAYSVLPKSGTDIIIVFSFKVRNNKTLQVFHSFNGLLYYAFTDSKGVIELFYTDEFVFDKNNQTLSFVNKNVKYVIAKDGITVITPKKKVHIKANVNSLEGDILSLEELDFENMLVK